MPGPLAGLRVLDLSRVLAGPFATMKLGDMGADVVKVEMPGRGDDTRAWGPPFQAGEACYYLAVNRSKRGITLDLKHPLGRAVLERMVRGYDVLIENFRPGTLDRLGFSWERIQTLNPRMIVCSISGYGQTGTRRTDPSYDLVIQGESGLQELTGAADGPPTKVGASLADLTAGMLAVEGILLALLERGTTGKGQRIDIALLDGMLAMFTYQAQNYFATGRSPRRLGNQHPTLTPYETFRTADGWINVGVTQESFWRALCEELERPELARDPRFASNADRVAHRAELEQILVPRFAARSSQEWVDRLHRRDVPCGMVRTVAQVLDDPARRERDMIVELMHPTIGALRMVGNPLKLSNHPQLPQRPPPTLGQHTAEVLAELGFSAEERAEMARAGAI